MRPLDWQRFWERNKGMPLHVMASDLTKERSIVLDALGGHFSSLREMTKCIAASMCLPAVAGDLAQVPSVEGLLADAQLYEPIPYRSAFEMGYTHALAGPPTRSTIPCRMAPASAPEAIATRGGGVRAENAAACGGAGSAHTAGRGERCAQEELVRAAHDAALLLSQIRAARRRYSPIPKRCALRRARAEAGPRSQASTWRPRSTRSSTRATSSDSMPSTPARQQARSRHIARPALHPAAVGLETLGHHTASHLRM